MVENSGCDFEESKIVIFKENSCSKSTSWQIDVKCYNSNNNDNNKSSSRKTKPSKSDKNGANNVMDPQQCDHHHKSMFITTKPLFWILLHYLNIHCHRCCQQEQQQQWQVAVTPFTVDNHCFQMKYNLLKHCIFNAHQRLERSSCIDYDCGPSRYSLWNLGEPTKIYEWSKEVKCPSLNCIQCQ